ncbi:rhomboid family intramembrane serine protease [Mollicutes bacterium LVI A0039]|nr:rhomboid family intramembrane serine protease [Mollicutes bacterium LVI A0039]
MYKLYAIISDKERHLLYQNANVPHLWFLATMGNSRISSVSFCDHLIEIASQVEDELFTDEIAQLVTYINAISGTEILIEGPGCQFGLEQLKTLVNGYDFEQVFGDKVDRSEFIATPETSDYFNQYRKQYRSQYRSVTIIIVALNVIVFAINLIVGRFEIQYIVGTMSLLNPLTYVSILLAGFTHFSIMHIFFNMTFLQSVGPMLERVLGTTKFLILYLSSLFISGMVVVLMSNPLTVTAGASGALYGLFAYFICFMMKHGTDPVHKRNVLGTFGLNIAFTLFVPGISIAGHLGGAIAGVLFFVITDSRK